MEVSRFRLLFLTCVLAAQLSGCSLFRRGDDTAAAQSTASAPASTSAGGDTVATTGEPASTQPIIDPEVERRSIKRARIDTEDFEVGAYVGILSIEDFESNFVYGGRFAYHLTEDFFIEATIGQSRAGR